MVFFFFFCYSLPCKCRNRETLFSKRVVAGFGETFVPVRGFHHIWNSASFKNHRLHWTELREGKYTPRALETGDLSSPDSIRIARGFPEFQNEDLVRLNLDPDAAVGVTMRKRMMPPSSLESYIEARILMLLLENWFCIRIRFFVMVVTNHRKEIVMLSWGEVVVGLPSKTD